MPNLINIYYIIIKHYIGRIIGWQRQLFSSGQTLLEYAVIIVLIVAAIAGIQLYLQRGLQGRHKAIADYALRVLASAQGTYGIYSQYDPYYDEADITTEGSSTVLESYSPTTGSTTVVDPEIIIRRGERKKLP